MRPDWDKYFIEIAKQVAKRSTCIRRPVGAVIVDKSNVIVSTGYNGPVRGASHCAQLECTTCRHYKVTRRYCEKRHLTTYPNSRCDHWVKSENTSVCIRDLQKTLHGASYDKCPGVHAEMNALIFAGKLAKGGTMYVNTWPCFQCAKLMINAEIAKLVYSFNEDDFNQEELELARRNTKFLEKFVQVKRFHENRSR